MSDGDGKTCRRIDCTVPVSVNNLKLGRRYCGAVCRAVDGESSFMAKLVNHAEPGSSEAQMLDRQLDALAVVENALDVYVWLSHEARQSIGE